MPSELKVNKLSPYTGTTLTLGDSGDTVSTDAVVQASQFIGGGLNAYRNIFINGDMSIAQRGTSATALGNGDSGYHTVDRWKFIGAGAPTFEFTQTQDTDVPTGQGFATSLKMDCTTAQGSLGVDEFLLISQRFEGQNLQYLKKGTSNAESLTLSFWVKSNKTGTYICEFQDQDNTRQISKSYTINASNTWEKKTITFEGDTTGAFDNDNARSLDFNFWLAAGTDWTSGTLATSWQSYNATDRAVGQVNLADSTSNDFWITGVQLEAGTTASDFEFLPVDVNLHRCQRYFSTNDIETDYVANGGSVYYKCYPLPVQMRANPTMANVSQWRYFSSGAGTNFTPNSINTASNLMFEVQGTGLTNCRGFISGGWSADAEL